MTTTNVIILVAFAVYMLIMIAIGFVYSKRTKNNEDYFLGGRNLGGWTAALSAQASDMSGWLLMGLPGSVYLAGTGEIWIAIGLLLGTILNWYLVSSRLRKYTIVAGNSLTIPSFFQNRYRDSKGVIKIVSAIIIAIFFAVYTASAFSSGAKLFATLFGNSTGGEMDKTAYLIGLIIASVVILVYTFMGGFKAVCTTDLIQGLLMLVAILAVPIVAYTALTWDQGFSQALVAKGVESPENYLNFFKNTDGTPISATSIISSLAWGLGYFGMPHIIIRFMAIKNEAEVKKSRKIAIIWVVLSLTAACLIGLIARGYLSQQLTDSSETAFIRLIQEIFSKSAASSSAVSSRRSCPPRTASCSSPLPRFPRICTRALSRRTLPRKNPCSSAESRSLSSRLSRLLSRLTLLPASWVWFPTHGQASAPRSAPSFCSRSSGSAPTSRVLSAVWLSARSPLSFGTTSRWLTVRPSTRQPVCTPSLSALCLR